MDMDVRVCVNGGFEHQCTTVNVREYIEGFLKAHPPLSPSQVPTGCCWTFDVWVNKSYRANLSFEVEGIKE